MLKLKQQCLSPQAPFSWDILPSSPPSSPTSEPPLSPPVQWLNAKEMRMYGAEPLRSEIGIVKCKECDKPILKSAILEHVDNCTLIRLGGNKRALEDAKKGKKRKAEDDEIDETGKKKSKPATKVTKGRFKGPIDYDRQCGVINDKHLPCSRSLTCKSHSMGAKRAVQGRSKGYDELLLEWNRAHNPNWVEPVKRETKAEKKEKKEKEKAEKKRLAGVAAAAALAAKSAGGAAPTKKSKKSAAVAPAAVVDEAEEENMDDVDSEAELDGLIKAVRSAQVHGLVGVPLAMPADAGTWFIERRERLRTCKDVLASALNSRVGLAAGTANGRII